jgi:hypothetical protein
MTTPIKIIGGIGIGIAVLGALLWYAQPTDTQPTDVSDKNAQQNALMVEGANSYDFGTISMKDGKVSTTFTIQNAQSEPVTLRKLYTSCMCTEATLKLANATQGPFGMLGHGFIPQFSETLQPNEEAVVEVVFDPAAHGPSGVGKIQRTVTVEHTAGQPVEFLVAANVTP